MTSNEKHGIKELRLYILASFLNIAGLTGVFSLQVTQTVKSNVHWVPEIV